MIHIQSRLWLADNEVMHGLRDSVSRLSIEILCLVFFCVGFILLQSGSKWFHGKQSHTKKRNRGAKSPSQHQSQPHIDAMFGKVELEAKAGQHQKALSAWRFVVAKHHVATPTGILKHVVEAFICSEKDQLVPEMIAHILNFRETLCNPKVAGIMLEVAGRAGQSEIMSEMMKIFVSTLRLNPDLGMYEMLIGGYAAAGKDKEVFDVIKSMRRAGCKVSPKALSLSIKGFLKHGLADAALQQTMLMKQYGYQTPPFAVTQILRLGGEANRTEEFVVALEHALPLPAEAVSYLFDALCAKQGRMEFVSRIEAWARRSNVPANSGAYDWLLRHWAGQGDARARDLFEEMQQTGARMTDSLLIGVLGRCAESKFVSFAERIISYVKSNQRGTVVLFSALMKVYVGSKMQQQACDLYEEVISQGLEPDAVMYSCLMRFAVECGRTALAEKLLQKVPELEQQNNLSLLRMAVRDGNAPKALDALKKLKECGQPVDIPAYNCALSVCVATGYVEQARKLIQEMHQGDQKIDVVAWNTLLKGYCTKGDLEGAKAMIQEMEAKGIQPDDITFNCIINGAVSLGDLQEAWNLLAVMENRGIKATHYTLSILMKPLRKGSKDLAPGDVARALALLDRSGLDIFGDQVLLIGVLEVCMRHRQHHARLQAILERLPSSGIEPTVQTYGMLIKVCGNLRRLQECKDMWHEMVNVRRLEPDRISLGCMIEVLVNNKMLEEAVGLMEEWQARVPLTEMTFATLMRGCAQAKMPEKALILYRQIREVGGKMTSQTYNWVIDAQSQLGAMDVVSELVAAMQEDGLAPDVNTSLNVLKGYCAQGDLEKARVVSSAIQDKHLVKETCVYNILFAACVRHSRVDMAAIFVADMQAHNITLPKGMLVVLTRFLARHGQTDKAMELFKNWQEQHVAKPNSTSASSTHRLWLEIVHGHVVEGKLDKACAALEHAKRLKIKLDSKLYSALIGACTRKGNLLKALALLDEAHGVSSKENNAEQQQSPVQRALPPGEWLDLHPAGGFHSLISALADRHGTEAADVVVRRHIEAGVPIDCLRLPFQTLEA